MPGLITDSTLPSPSFKPCQRYADEFLTSVFFLPENTELLVHSGFLEMIKDFPVPSFLGNILLSYWSPRKVTYSWYISIDVPSQFRCECTMLETPSPPRFHSCACPVNHQDQSDLLQTYLSGSGPSFVPTGTTLIQLLVILTDPALTEFCSCLFFYSEFFRVSPWPAGSNTSFW